MKVLTVKELNTCGVRTLALDAEAFNLFSVEAIAASLRRAAGFLCPCPHRTLIQAVVKSLELLEPTKGEQLYETVETTLESMIGCGELLEEFEVGVMESSDRSTLLYAAPPSFISRESKTIFLVGIAPDHNSALPQRLAKRIEYVGHLRRLVPEDNDDLQTELKQLGLSELSMDVWLRKPRLESSSEYLKRIGSRLQLREGEIEGLSILNSEKPVTHYRRRWEQVKNQSGRFIARRPQPYGNDLWCYVELIDGRANKLLNLPIENGSRGCDEAWRLQLAIDAERGLPQSFTVTEKEAFAFIDFFSPVPIFALRRWAILGEPVNKTTGLFGYKFRSEEIPQEIRFMQQELWLRQVFTQAR